MVNKINNVIRLLFIPAIILLTGLVLVVPVGAQLDLPHAFFGNITINGDPAPIGTKVEARCQGVLLGVSGNPIMTSEVGKYGTEAAAGAKLLVQGPDIKDNAIIYFYINNHAADQTYNWKTGEITKLDLSLTTGGSTPGDDEDDTETLAPPINTIQFSLFGEERNVSVSSEGKILESVKLTGTLPTGQVTLTINVGTFLLDKDGNPITHLTSELIQAPPPAPDSSTIYIACSFGPEGATFDPSILLTFEYNASDIPAGVDVNDLIIAVYDSSGDWVTLPSAVDTDNHLVTAPVSHFSTFAVMFPNAEPPAPSTPATQETPSATPPAQTSSTSEPDLTEASPTPGTVPEDTSAPLTTPASEENGPGTDWNPFIIAGAVLIGGILVGLLIRWTRQRND